METDGYRDGTALWAAASARAKAVARSTGADVSTILRRFVSERFLARVFSDPDGAWVLKGGTAVVSALPDDVAVRPLDDAHPHPGASSIGNSLRPPRDCDRTRPPSRCTS